MLNKLKAIILVVLSLTVAAIAQETGKGRDNSIPGGLYSPLDKFLTEGSNPQLRLSDVSRTAQMLSWVVDGSFTHQQFDEFKEIIVAEWREGNQETIRFINDWVSQADKLATVKKYAEQIAMKEKLRPGVVADIKKHPDDPKRVLIRRIYRKANGENSLGDFKVKPRVIKSSGSLKDILGDWMNQSVQGVEMKSEKLSILANGKVTFSEIQSGQSGNCFLTQTLAKEGALQVAGGTAMFDFQGVKLQRIDSCQPNDTKPKTMPAESQKFTWQIKSDENEILWLCLAGANGKKTCLKKKD